MKEDKESETIVEIENIFDKDIAANSKDVPLLELFSSKDKIVNNTSNDNISFTNVDECGDMGLEQDINNKY